MKTPQCGRVMIVSDVTLSVISLLYSKRSRATASLYKGSKRDTKYWSWTCSRDQHGGDENKRGGRKMRMNAKNNYEQVGRTSNVNRVTPIHPHPSPHSILALPYLWLFECSIVPEAFLSCLSDTCALRSPPLTDAISHTGSETTRFQSHHCCEGNCSGLSHKSAPPCALQAKTYIYTLSQCTPRTHAFACTHTNKTTLNFFHHFCQNQRGPLLNLSLSCFCFKYPCLDVVGCWIYRQNPPHVLHVHRAYCLHRSFTGSTANISTTQQIGQELSVDHSGGIWV